MLVSGLVIFFPLVHCGSTMRVGGKVVGFNRSMV
jgi:hypothetical protein